MISRCCERASAHRCLARAGAPEQQSLHRMSLFTTGSGQGVTISAASLRRGQELMRDTDGGAAEPAPKKPAKPAGGPPRAGSSLFQTGSGQGVTISAASLRRGQELMRDTDGGAAEPAPKKQRRPAKPAGGPPRAGSSLFTTGSGQGVTISAASLRRGQELMRDAAPEEPARRRPSPQRSTAAAPTAAPRLRPEQRVQIAQNRAKAEQLRRERKQLVDVQRRQAELASKAERDRQNLARRQRQLPAVGAWSAAAQQQRAREEQERASRKAPDALLSTPPPDAKLVMKRRPPVFNSYLPATAVTHGRDELLSCACEAACT